MKKLMLLGLILFVMLTVGCTQQTQYTCPDKTTVNNPDLCPKPKFQWVFDKIS